MKLLLALSVLLLEMSAMALTAYDLQCENDASPFNVDVARPRLSWKLKSTVQGDRQNGYQILVASSPERLSRDEVDLWDSGKVTSSQTMQIEYAGKELPSTTIVHWKLRVWDCEGKASEWTAPAMWSMGLLKPEDWQAKWIGGDASFKSMPVFRKRLSVANKPARAMVYICGVGQFEMHLNGMKVGNDLLQPGWTNYRKTLLYCAYDITSQFSGGDNQIDVLLGNGMYHVEKTDRYKKFTGSFGQPMLIAQVHLAFDDGTTQIIGTDRSWQCAAGPTTYCHIYGGEDYDARLASPAQWVDANELPTPAGVLRGSSQSAPVIHIQKTFSPVSTTTPKPGVTVYDFGQNCSMIPEIRVRGKSGATIKLIAGELLKEGLVSQKSTGGPVSYSYTCSGEGEETWSPKFTYYGARYLQVETTEVEVLEIRSNFICSTMPAAGTFECSNELFNRTRALIDWAIRSNAMSVLTDCPHRERLGWLEQTYLMGPAIMYSYALPKFFTKVSGDMADAQNDDGLVPDIAPEYTRFPGGFLDSPEWGSACILVPWQCYRWYGDRAILERSYPMMQRYMAYLGTKAQDHLLDHGLGDWYDLGPKPPGESQLTPKGVTATATWFLNARVMQQIALLLGKPQDAEQYDELSMRIREAFLAKYYDAAMKRIATSSQTAMAMPVVVGLMPEADVPQIIGNLVADIRASDNALTAGDVGYYYLLRALADHGYSDVIFDMNTRSDRPGYGFILSKGATALTEAWTARESSSHNHFMLGHLLAWFYNDLVGIGQADDSIAFEKIIIRPAVVGDVTWAKASYDSARGMIAASWKREASVFVLEVSIPPGSTARVFVPADRAQAINVDEARLIQRQNSLAEFEVESGNHRFEVR